MRLCRRVGASVAVAVAVAGAGGALVLRKV